MGKKGLIKSRIGLNVTVSRALFVYGKIHIKCVSIIEDGILQGYTDDDGSSHQILSILLPEQLKRERPPAEFVGKWFARHFATNIQLILSFFSSQWFFRQECVAIMDFLGHINSDNPFRHVENVNLRNLQVIVINKTQTVKAIQTANYQIS